MSNKDALLTVHSRALTAHDVDTILGHATHDVRCVCDGRAVGEGRDSLRALLEHEYHGQPELLGRVFDLDGETVVAEFAGHEDPKPHGIVRFKALGDRVMEFDIDHGHAAVSRVAAATSKLR